MAEGAEEPLALALAALGRKERTVAELAAWLNERGVGAEEVEAVIEQLAGAGVLDDARFAHRYAEDKRELSGWGSERIRSTLLERGIAVEDADAALATEHEHELERAVGVLRKRGAPLADDRDRGRALAALLRRGYEPELAYAAIRRAREAA